MLDFIIAIICQNEILTLEASDSLGKSPTLEEGDLETSRPGLSTIVGIEATLRDEIWSHWTTLSRL